MTATEDINHENKLRKDLVEVLHYRQPTEPTLGSLLDNYREKSGREDHKRKRTGKRGAKKGGLDISLEEPKDDSKTAMNRLLLEDASLIEETHVIIQRRKQRDQRLLQRLSDDEQERYLYYLRFRDLQIEKAERQREDMMRRTKLEERRRQKLAEAKKAHKLQKRLERMALHHDDTFLKGLEKSEYYRMVEAEQRYMKEGKLKYQADRDYFWRTKKLPEHPDGLGIPVDLPRLSTLDLPEEMDRITEADEQSRPTTIHTPSQKPMSRTGRYSAKQLAALFPRTEMPSLHCYELDFSEKQESEEEMRRNMKAEKRNRKMEQRRDVTNQMYQIALSHNATAKRIIEEHMDEFARDFLHPEKSQISDFTICATAQSKRSSQKKEEEEILPIEYFREMSSGLRMIKDQPLDDFRSVGSRHNPTPVRSLPELLSSESAPASVASSTHKGPVPLSMMELEERVQIRNPLKPPAIWSNYLKAGKLKFAPLDEPSVTTNPNHNQVETGSPVPH